MTDAPSVRRQLVVCCDGTNNTLTGGQHDTNVLRIFEALRAEKHDHQVLYYDPGVGSPDSLPPTDVVQWLRRKWDRLSGLASGQGIYENITQAYSFLLREYRKGDEIWLFGFSRGAFAARSVAGMINLFGLLRPEHRVMLPTLVRTYFSSTDGGSLPMKVLKRLGLGAGQRTRQQVAEQIRRCFTSPAGSEAEVYFVGVWDTVESVGPPGFSLQISSSGTIKKKQIRHVRHALSLDEHRWPFLPRLYTDDNFGQPTDRQSLRQVWFRGVHSDVGGGYAAREAGLSDRALEWMVAEANRCGLGCTVPAAGSGARKAHDPLYSTPLWALVGMTVRATDHPSGTAEAVAKYGPVGDVSLTEARPKSVWDTRRPAGSFLVAVVGAFASLLLSGYMLREGSGWAAFVEFATTPGKWGEAALKASELALAQLSAWLDVHGPFDVASAPGACPRRALLFDLAFIACYSYVLTRLCSRAFARRAGWREVGQAKPRLRVLGAALPLLVAGDVAEDVLGILAFTAGPGSVLGSGLLCLGVLGGAAKVAGLLGCLLLLGVGALPQSANAQAGSSDARILARSR